MGKIISSFMILLGNMLIRVALIIIQVRYLTW